jgi:hypothetical protein
VAGTDPRAIGHADSDGVMVAGWIEVGAIGHEVVSSGASVSDGIFSASEWGTLSSVVFKILVIFIACDTLWCCPELSELPLIGLGQVALGATHGIVAGGLQLVVVCRTLACVACVVVGNVATVRPTIVEIVSVWHLVVGVGVAGVQQGRMVGLRHMVGQHHRWGDTRVAWVACRVAHRLVASGTTAVGYSLAVVALRAVAVDLVGGRQGPVGTLGGAACMALGDDTLGVRVGHGSCGHGRGHRCCGRCSVVGPWVVVLWP